MARDNTLKRLNKRLTLLKEKYDCDISVSGSNGDWTIEYCDDTIMFGETFFGNDLMILLDEVEGYVRESHL